LRWARLAAGSPGADREAFLGELEASAGGEETTPAPKDSEARALDEVTAHLRELLTLRRNAPDAVSGRTER
jgi:hypothetical protein